MKKYIYILIVALIISCNNKQDRSIVNDLNTLIDENWWISHNLKVAPFSKRVGEHGSMPDPFKGEKIDTVFVLKNSITKKISLTKLNQGKVVVMDSLSLLNKAREYDKSDSRFGRCVYFPCMLRFEKKKNRLKIYMERWVLGYPDGFDKKGIPLILDKDLIYIK